MQAFLIALAMEIIKYYGPKLTDSTKKAFAKHLELKENEQKAGEYNEAINKPDATLDDMLSANDEFGR